MSDLTLFKNIVVSAMKQEEIFNCQVEPLVHKRLSQVGKLPRYFTKQTLWEHNFQAVKYVDVLMENLNHKDYSTSPEHRRKVLFLATALHHICRNLEAHQTEEIKAVYEKMGRKLNFDEFWKDWHESLSDIAFLTYNSEGHYGNLIGPWGDFYQDKRELILQMSILNYADIRGFGIDQHPLLSDYKRFFIFQIIDRNALENLVIT